MSGYDRSSWQDLETFTGRVALPDDVEHGSAVFAVGDAERPRPLPMLLPQPVIWWAEEGPRAAVAVQGEAHEVEDGSTAEVVGLVLPEGGTVLVLLEDVDLVEETDPVWVDLMEEALAAGDDD